MLWLTGKTEEAAQVAAPADATLPRQIDMNAVFLLAVRAAVSEPPERSALMDALCTAQASPELAAETVTSPDDCGMCMTPRPPQPAPAEDRQQGGVCGTCRRTGLTCRVRLRRLPAYLCVHLKRFRHATDGTPAAKLPAPVAAPALYAAVHHYGGCAAGHYTATCRVAHRWVGFDDSHASAYLLFYRLR
eukprot:gene48700-28974_t